jgi:HD-GYP domain-containing protein (c-di-GMP phosphodiesterase class II)
MSAVLAATVVFVSPIAALAAVCGFLWVAVFLSLRALRDERRRVDGYLMTMRDQHDAVVGAFCAALDLKDGLSSQHTQRVSRIACTIAAEMGVRKEDIRLLQKSAILADVGKAEIAQTILAKPGALNEEEWKQMQRHPELGYELLVASAHLRDSSDIVRSHHERFDGQGYPRQLKGEEIPLAARIFAVADSYIAMTSDRPHRKKLTHETAVKEVLRNSLTQFDPEVVRAFVRCEERGLLNPSATVAAQVEEEKERALGVA